jgi:polyphosphate kinase 2
VVETTDSDYGQTSEYVQAIELDRDDYGTEVLTHRPLVGSHAQFREEIFAGNAYPYPRRIGYDDYQTEKYLLQIELVKLQKWIKSTGERVIVLFEGRDAAGKGGTIKRFMEHMNPRGARVVALEKPTDLERGQWYFQRYVQHLPSQGEIVLFDRSWYNRAGVERVMDFATEEQYKLFIKQVPVFERLITDEGIRLFKLYFSVGKQEQQERFASRSLHPLKQWKLSPIDLLSRDKWDEYTAAKRAMFYHTHTEYAPWTIVKSDDKMRARLNAMRHLLTSMPYTNKTDAVELEPDPLIVAQSDEVFPTKWQAADISDA